MNEPAYIVHDTGQGHLKIVDVHSGIQAGIISPRGKLVTPPMVSGDRVSFIVEDDSGDRKGSIHSLPSGSLLTYFRA
jgi:hypothetical protein